MCGACGAGSLARLGPLAVLWTDHLVYIPTSSARLAYTERSATRAMRHFILLAFVTMMGCSMHTRLPVFNTRSTDVLTASAEPLDKSRLSASTNAPDFEAQIRIVFTEDGARRYVHFLEKHAGQDYEFQVNGKVLVPAVGAYRVRVSEVLWFTRSMEEAQHFATSLNKK